ncbi:MAG: hypothetical protein U0934_07500 [Pseudotabrizicola sp.]|uniref:hypothetical protein n=1 Tax=Pseudotabrizicola sp. TaxID=2939647 RepID=UPI0027191EF4|nr:hypothetical protein [Pseudotabrizicola sp.]MDO8882760.1 hypothetical protein [Pseudotabrizicola sp.]MDP2080371.1 hypothetical protein [Pseudotabrizicola sp.]MDZ7573785.1 hypothetical protein [Pseudotabrizicola sp.]
MTQQTLKTDGASLTIHLGGPHWNGMPAATIGNVSFKNAGAGAQLLDQALRQIGDAGRDRVLGPMAGDTWHSYRFVSETDGSPPFLLEPTNRPEEPEIFAAAGFAPVARYFSARMPLAKVDLTPPPQTDAFTIETWDGTDPDRLLREVFTLSSQAFSSNAFYTPITQDAFLAMYQPVMPLMKRDLIFFARRRDGALAGYLFAMPNYAEGSEPKSVILKTYASRERGAGRHLVHACHSAALGLGFETVIHALIHDDNVSAERSQREGAQIFRRYALLGRQLNG